MNDTKLLFLDSNIWLYVLGTKTDNEKHRIADRLIELPNIRISVQVIGEICNALLRKTIITESRIQETIEELYDQFQPWYLRSRNQMVSASKLRERYNFSHWDSFIVLAALESNCSTLYSEDMQDGLVIDGTLTIRNPFKD
ncbi:MAG TPA: PIN domain-containing protein [Candidatus Kapabacteria bacterium]|jgi:predicted nucleic acid-binding protein